MFKLAKICIAAIAFASTIPSLAQEDIFIPPKPNEPKRFCKQAEKFYRLMERSREYEEITDWNGLRLELRYGTFNNLSGHDLYCGGTRAFLHKDAAKKLKKAIEILPKVFTAETYPNVRFVIYDAMRPLYAQEALRAPVRGTKFSHFVSSPSTGSLHNYGMAIDLGIESDNGLVDMGTDFDTFERAAGQKYEKEALLSGRLSKEQVNNREMFRKVMKQAGFIPLPSEWWHFNALPSAQVRENYSKIQF